MHGLFRSEMEPPATGQSFWMAVENQRLTSSGVSVFAIVQVFIAPVPNICQCLCLGGKKSRSLRAPFVRHAAYAKTRMDMEAEIG
jgi:hypothetical protein